MRDFPFGVPAGAMVRESVLRKPYWRPLEYVEPTPHHYRSQGWRMTGVGRTYAQTPVTLLRPTNPRGYAQPFAQLNGFDDIIPAGIAAGAAEAVHQWFGARRRRREGLGEARWIALGGIGTDAPEASTLHAKTLERDQLAYRWHGSASGFQFASVVLGAVREARAGQSDEARASYRYAQILAAQLEESDEEHAADLLADAKHDIASITQVAPGRAEALRRAAQTEARQISAAGSTPEAHAAQAREHEASKWAAGEGLLDPLKYGISAPFVPGGHLAAKGVEQVEEGAKKAGEAVGSGLTALFSDWRTYAVLLSVAVVGASAAAIKP